MKNMNSEEAYKSVYDDDFNLKEFLAVIWSGKKFILINSLILSLVTALAVLRLDNYFISEVLLVPSAEESSNTQGFSGLASLAGIDISSGSPDKTKEALAVLNSRKFIVDFIIKYNLMVPILATDGYDPINQELSIDQNIYDEERAEWKKDVNLQLAYDKFVSKHYSVSSDILGSGLVTVRIQFISPQLAKEWVDLIVQEINQRFKEQEILEANKSLTYLNSQLSTQNMNLDMKQVIYQLIQEQTSLLVLANGKDEFMFRTVDPAYVANKKAGPLRSVYVTLGFFVGAMISIFALFIAFYNNRTIHYHSKFPWLGSKKI